MSMKMRSAIVLAALVAGLASPVAAEEYRGTPAERAACRPNVFRYCAGEIPNVRAITACLRRNMSRLSPDCQAVFMAADQKKH